LCELLIKFVLRNKGYVVKFNTLTDSELLALLQQGDHAAFHEIYERYSGVLYNFAFKKLQDEEEAKDAVQDIFITMWNRHSELTVHSSLSGYLFKSVSNRALSIFTHKKYEAAYIASFDSYLLSRQTPQADEQIREKDLQLIIEREIDALPEKMREIFRLSRYEQLSHKEIGERLGVSELTSKTQVKRALRQLRMRLGLLTYLLFLLHH